MSDQSVAADQLRLLIERVERLEEEKKGINDDIKDVYLEAKATGFDAPMMRKIVQLRKMDPNDRREMEAILQTYLAALGMDNDGSGHTTDMFPAHDGRPRPERPAPSPAASDSERFNEALSLVVDNQNASTSWLQRQMRIGYNAATRLVEELERAGAVGPPNHLGRRDVLVPANGQAHPALARLHETLAASGTGMSMSVNGGPMVEIVPARSPGATH